MFSLVGRMLLFKSVGSFCFVLVFIWVLFGLRRLNLGFDLWWLCWLYCLPFGHFGLGLDAFTLYGRFICVWRCLLLCFRLGLLFWVRVFLLYCDCFGFRLFGLSGKFLRVWGVWVDLVWDWYLRFVYLYYFVITWFLLFVIKVLIALLFVFDLIRVLGKGGLIDGGLGCAG